MKRFLLAAAVMLAFGTATANAVELDKQGRDPQYVNTIIGRAQKVTDALGITGTDKGTQVLNIVANRYFKLNDIYSERDSIKKVAGTLTGDAKKQKQQEAESTKDMKLYRSHFGFIADLSLFLREEVEKMEILAWLKEAREYAIDAESSKKKHEAFGKYKGRINNYLSKRGYNLTKEREAWAKRVKARGETL